MHIWTQQAQQESAWASEKVALDEKKQATTHSAQSGACLPQRNQQAQRPCVQVCGGGGWKCWGTCLETIRRRAEKVRNDNRKDSHRRTVPKAATSGSVYRFLFSAVERITNVITIYNLMSLTLRGHVACQHSASSPSFPLPPPIHR